MVIYVLAQFSNAFACCGVCDTEEGLSSDHTFFVVFEGGLGGIGMGLGPGGQPISATQLSMGGGMGSMGPGGKSIFFIFKLYRAGLRVLKFEIMCLEK